MNFTWKLILDHNNVCLIENNRTSNNKNYKIKSTNFKLVTVNVDLLIFARIAGTS